jgi:hypothetical protein
MGAGQCKSWSKYLKDIGLSDEKPINETMKKSIAKRSHSVAERIMKMDRKKKK